MYRYIATCAFLLFAGLRYTEAGLNIVPENDAVVAGEGRTVVLRCGSDTPLPTARILWTEFATTPLGQVVSDNRGIVPTHPHAARYTIIGNVATDEFFLQISNVSVNDGGTYLCQDVNGSPPSVFRGFAELVVLESEPQCTDYATGSGVVIDGSLYSSECEVFYRGNLIPYFQWFGPPGYFTQNGTQSPTRVWSWMYFTALREIDAQIFYHTTNFTTVINSDPNYATNIPTYNHTFRGPPLDVSWPPNHITITPIKPTYELGDVLTCSPDSKPPSATQWQNMRTLEFAPPGPTFTITADLVGFDQTMRCNAAVLIDGSLYTNDVFLNVSVPIVTTTPSPTAPPTTTPPPPDGPCDNLTGRWQAANPSATICLDVDTKGNILVIIRNGTDLFFVAGRGKTVYEDYRHVGFTSIWPNTGVGGFSGECHKCFGTEVLLMSGLSRNKHASEICGASVGTQLTNLYVFTRSGPACIGMEVDEVRTTHPWIVDKMGVKAKKITAL